MKSAQVQQILKSVEQWLEKMPIVLLLPALGIGIYLFALDIRSFISDNSQNALPDRIIQGITCPSLMAKDTPYHVDVRLHNPNLETEQTTTISIVAPHFGIISFQSSDTMIITDQHSSATWLVIPYQTGEQIITISATTNNGLSDEVNCKTTVIYFLGLNLDNIYGIDIAFIIVGILSGMEWLRERRKQHQTQMEKEFSFKPKISRLVILYFVPSYTGIVIASFVFNNLINHHPIFSSLTPVFAFTYTTFATIMILKRKAFNIEISEGYISGPDGKGFSTNTFPVSDIEGLDFSKQSFYEKISGFYSIRSKNGQRVMFVPFIYEKFTKDKIYQALRQNPHSNAREN